jgi:hypothetical protein
MFSDCSLNTSAAEHLRLKHNGIHCWHSLIFLYSKQNAY